VSTERPCIAVDLLYFTGKRGGTETYARQLLPRIAARCPEIDFVALTNATGRDAIAAWFPGRLHDVRIGGDNRLVWALAETLAVAPAAERMGADLLWCPANFGPSGGRVPTVVTLHDVIAFDYPNPEVSWPTRATTSWIIRRAARGARRILTDSDDAADSIVRALGVDRGRITPTPLASAPPGTVDDPERELAAIGVPVDRPFVLSTGNRMRHKNFDGLLRGIAAISPGRRPRVVITGSHGPDPLRALVTELSLDDDVRLLGWVTTPQLEALFAQASLYVCPSLAEGFGLPVLDAMTRGCSVLASDIPVLREVGGDAAEYTDTRDPQGLGSAIASIIADAELRERLSSAGRARAAGFSWDRTADQTVEVLRGALAAAGASVA
jgi:glycosyltransferase involved in cell wall biosynthesis